MTTSSTLRIGLGIVALAAAILLFVVLQDDGGGEADSRPDQRESQGMRQKPEGEPIPTIAIEGGEPVGGVRELSYAPGDRIRFRVRSDVADEVHVHGYDLSKGVGAGGTVAFDFPATIEGLFEAELEHRGEHILELRVAP